MSMHRSRATAKNWAMSMSMSMSIILSKQSMNMANFDKIGKDSTDVQTPENVVILISNTMVVPCKIIDQRTCACQSATP